MTTGNGAAGPRRSGERCSQGQTSGLRRLSNDGLEEVDDVMKANESFPSGVLSDHR